MNDEQYGDAPDVPDAPPMPPATDPAPRAIIHAFARAMERKLAENDGVKAEWSGESAHWLWDALRAEVRELRDALDAWLYWGGQWPDAVLSEAADVALYAMMIADVSGALPATTDRGRVLVEDAPVTFAPGTVRMASPLCDTREVW